MKMNVKLYNSLNNPVDVQEVDGTKIEIHYMNDTNYLARYAGSGQFTVWASDGIDYKLLIERGYYEELGPLFQASVNGVWVKLYKKINELRRKMLFVFVLPVLVLLLAAIVVTAFVPGLKQYSTVTLIVSLVLVLVVNIIQSNFIRKKVDVERDKSIDEIQLILGADLFESLIHKQRDYHENYFNFDDDELPVEEETAELVDEEVEDLVEEIVVVDGVVKDEPEEELVVKEAEIEESVIKEPVVEKKVESNGLELLTVGELREFAKDRNVANYSSMRKAELVDNLPSSLNDLKVAELRAIAKAKEVPNYSAMRKQELIDSIK